MAVTAKALQCSRGRLSRGRSVDLFGPLTEMGRADKAAMDGFIARYVTWDLQV